MFETASKDEELKGLLGEVDTKDGPEVVATVAFEDAESVRPALSAPLFQLVRFGFRFLFFLVRALELMATWFSCFSKCTIDLKPEADRESLLPSVSRLRSDWGRRGADVAASTSS